MHILDWTRQCAERVENGVYSLAQRASAYFVRAQSCWKGLGWP
jgi:hypothetical protein